jgi:glutamate-1-semialdehyde 2,1-aminomutase
VESNRQFDRALQVLAGGVNSPVRSWKALGRPPFFTSRAAGKHLYTTEGNPLLDFCCSWGPLILGHAHPLVTAAASEAILRGTSYGTPTEIETQFAARICATVPSIEKVRFVNSGTEAVMSALRLARGFTGRDTIVKFDGCYHGHSDSMLVAAGSGVSGLAESTSAGIPQEGLRSTLSLPFNDIDAVARVFRERGERIAAVIVEPVAGNMGVVLPRQGFLETLRKLTVQSESLLIFDEVITGFRLAAGGAQERFGIIPDLTILGKIIGGGFPVGAFGGRADIMAYLAPDGPVYQAGTLSGNPVALHAGYAAVDYLVCNPHRYGQMERMVLDFSHELRRHTGTTVNCIGSMFTVFATDHPVESYQDASRQDPELFRKRFFACLEGGIYLPPSMFESAFVSTAHTPRDLEELSRCLSEAA